MSKILLMLICLSTFTLTLAQDGQLMHSPAKANCDEALKVCSYISQNITAKQLISRINSVMFPDAPLDPREGFVVKETDKKINFWFNSTELRDRFIALTAMYDTFEDFVPSALVLLETEIFAISDEGLTNLMLKLGLSNAGAGPTTGTDNGITLAYGIGNFMLSASLTAVRTLGQATRVSTYKQVLPNYSDINFNHTTTVFVSPTPGQYEKQETGVKINGSISIANGEESRVLIHDYNLYYGVEVPSRLAGDSSRVNALNIQNRELTLETGVNHIVASLNSFETSRSIGLGLPLSFQSQVKEAKLLVITRARAFSYEQFINENRALRNTGALRTFSSTDVDNFPAGSIPLEVLVKSLNPYAFSTLSGDRAIGFKFDQTFARKDNIKKALEIKITSKKFKQQEVRTVEQLMLNGIKLNDLPTQSLRSHIVKVKVAMRPLGKKLGWPYKKTLFYNPTTNEFYK